MALKLVPKKTVGLDIGSSYVKAVQLRKAGKNIEVDKFGMAEIYAGIDKKAAGINRRQAIIDAVRQALADGGISAKFCVSAVCGESIIVRYIQLPDMPENELRGAIRWEAEDYIPFPLEEVNLDHMILGRSTGESGGAAKTDVLLVAAKKDLVGEHMDIIKGADLTPAIIDVDSFAFLNSFEWNYQPSASEVIAVLNIGAEITSINVYMGGVSRFSRDIGIAGDTITAGVQQRLGCSFQRAEELKIKEGAPSAQADDMDTDFVSDSSLLDTIRGTVERITGEDLAEDSPDFVAAQVIKTTLGNLTGEIKRSIQFFENQANGKPVQRVIIGGGTANMTNVDKYFAHELGLQVEIADPLRTVGVSGDASRAKQDRTRNMLGVSIGLALRMFD